VIPKQSSKTGRKMDRFDAMQAFVRVVDAGSFTKAANTLHISKTTVTQLVQQLEARLRVKLLNRTTRKVNVTADGAAYYERVVRLLADMDDVETSLSSASASLRGRLRVDVPSPLARLILVPALPTFHARYPEIQIHLGVSDRTVDLIGEKVDCILRGGELADESLVARRVGDLQAGVYAAPDYLARAGELLDPRQLEGPQHRIVGFLSSSTGKIFPYSMRRDGKTVEVLGNYFVAVDDGNAYLEAGLAGLGALWMPKYMAQGPLLRGELLQLFEGWSFDPMPLYVAYRPNRHVSTKLRVFIDWIVELMAEQAPIIPQSAQSHQAKRARKVR
jgi:DNA-binding transcriptional LysR family regulator